MNKRKTREQIIAEKIAANRSRPRLEAVKDYERQILNEQKSEHDNPANPPKGFTT